MAGISAMPQPREGAAVYLGIDVSSVSWHLTARCAGETILSASFPPRQEGLSTLLDRLKKCRVRSAYETGPFGYGLHDWLTSRGVESSVVPAARIPVVAGNKVKTDRRDSLKLATTLEAGMVRSIYVPSPESRADRELVRQRQRVQWTRCTAMARLKSFFLTYGIPVPPEAGTHWKGTFVAWLKKLRLEDPVLHEVFENARSLYFDLDERVKRFDVRLRDMARSQRYAEQMELLTTVPGIGTLTALTLAVEIVDWSRFTSGEAFSAFAGLTPSEYSSGDKIRHGKITRQGNAILRRILVESSWVLIRKDPGMRRFYEEIKIRRGAKRAIVAVARKLCHRIVAIMRTQEVYRVGADGAPQRKEKETRLSH